MRQSETINYKLLRKKKEFTNCFGNCHDVIKASYNSQTDKLSTTLYLTIIQVLRLEK